MTVYQALHGLGYPVTHPPYKGNERTYITYQLIGQTSTLYAEGEEKLTAVRYSVDLYTSQEIAALISEIKGALQDAGWICVVDMEIYEQDTALRHIAMTATAVGGIYG